MPRRMGVTVRGTVRVSVKGIKRITAFTNVDRGFEADCSRYNVDSCGVRRERGDKKPKAKDDRDDCLS